MTPLVVENEPPVTFLRRKMTGGRFSMGVVIRRYTGTCIKMFWPRGGSRARGGGVPLLQKTSSDRKAAATNRIYTDDLEAFVMKCCCFWFHSVV